MSGGMGGWGVPGVGSERSVSEREILWGADNARNSVLWQNSVVSSAARDAGSSPTSILRTGLLMGKITSTGELEEWDADTNDGTEVLCAVLDVELKMLDYDATAQDRVFRTIAARAPLKAGMLLIQGSAFVGHADEYLARRALAAAHCILDDDPFGIKAGAPGFRVSYETATTDTLTAAQNGMLLFYMNVASVTVTLPAIKPGLEYYLQRVGDEEIVIVSTEGDNVIVGNDLSADGVTFTTAGEHLGAAIRVRSVYVNTTLKWLIELPYVPFGTGVNTLTFGIQT